MRREHDETSRKMRAFREEYGIKFDEMARRCGVSGALLSRLEHDDWITHPKIAARICKEYRLTVDDYNAIVHEDYHAHKLPKPEPKPGQKGYGATECYTTNNSDDLFGGML